MSSAIFVHDYDFRSMSDPKKQRDPPNEKQAEKSKRSSMPLHSKPMKQSRKSLQLLPLPHRN